MRARVVVLSIIVACGLLISRPAGAETRPPDGDAYVDEDGNPTVTVGDGTPGGPGGGGPGGSDPCVWDVIVEDDFAVHVYDADGQVQFSETGRWLQKVCPGVGAVAVGGLFIIPEGGAVDVEALAEEALASVSIPGPAIRTSPDIDRIYVRVPTWLWVDGTWWHGYQATASAGRVSATVTATPRSSSWTLGDGSTVRCDGPGIAWHLGLPEDATSCAHTYTTSSAGRPGDTFSLSAAVQLDVSWTSNIGQGGTLPAISRTSTQPIVVGEIQAVGTSG